MKILLINDREPFDQSCLAPFQHQHEVVCWQTKPADFDLEEIIHQHGDADIMIVTYQDLNAKTLARFANLKAIIATTTAIEYIDLDYAKSHNIAVFNNTGYTRSAVAEHLFSLMLSVARRIPRLNHHTKKDDFEQFDQVGFELFGKTLGILGMGYIGQCFAQLVSGLEMTIQYHARTRKDLPYAAVDLEQLLSTSDVVAVTLPLTQNTKGLFNYSTLAMMKDNSIIVSISPDDVFDHDALVAALKSEKFFGVGLDIHHPQPDLYPVDNVILTPTKGWYTKECLQRRTQSWVDSLQSFLAKT